MVLTAAQTTAVLRMTSRWPYSTAAGGDNDLTNFDEDSLSQLADNLQCPGGCVPDPNPAAISGATIPMPTFTFGVKSQMRIGIACNLV